MDQQDAELDVDNFDFRPINRGLGFHQEKKKKPIIIRKSEPMPKFNSINHPAKVKKSTLPPGKTYANKQVRRDSLKSFYEAGTTLDRTSNSTDTNKIKEKFSNKAKSKNKSKTKSASNLIFHLQFAAWFVDFIIVTLLVAVTCVLFAVSLDVEIAQLKTIFYKNNLLIELSILFLVYYTTYFTILDVSSTPGKTLFKIELTNSKGKKASIGQCFIRATVVLFSFMALFLPLIIDFQGKLSDTKISKRS
ncbi:MAG: RDD family protein [Bacteriovoracaceae bacterium]|nr:RDD family protein [Bacteriovoracaceae bacterium]